MAGAHLALPAHSHTVTFGGSEVDEDGVLRYRILVFDGHDQWAVRRRYREFLRVFDAVKDECSDCSDCPAFPAKSQIRKRCSERFRGQRYEGLEAWLTAIVKLDPTLEAAPDLEAFLRPTANLSEFAGRTSLRMSLSSNLSSCSTALPSAFSSDNSAASKIWI